MTKRNCKRFRNNKYGCLDGLRWCGLRGNWCMSAQSDKYKVRRIFYNKDTMCIVISFYILCISNLFRIFAAVFTKGAY